MLTNVQLEARYLTDTTTTTELPQPLFYIFYFFTLFNILLEFNRHGSNNFPTFSQPLPYQAASQNQIPSIYPWRDEQIPAI